MNPIKKIILLFVLGTFLGNCLTAAEAQALHPEVQLPERGLCAHRGAMATHPENTVSAFREAIRCGAHMIELDVWLTKDSKLVVIHDSTVDRTTNGTGKIAELTFEEIRRLDAGSWKSARFEGQRVPSLEEALSMMPVNVWLNVHLKGGEELGREVAKVILNQNRLHQAFLACTASAAQGAKSVDPGILICNMEGQGGSWKYVNESVEMNADFIQLLGSVSPAFHDYSQVLQEADIRINYFGTDSPGELRLLFELGVEFPLVNNIAETMKVAKDLGLMPVQPLYFGQLP